MFGQAGNTSFGFNTASQNSPFGQSTFGKTIATTSFGTNTPPVFGSNSSLFNTKVTGSTTGNLFGNTTATATFGANSTPQSTFGAFGSTNTNTSLFGTQQNANTSLFGSSTTAPTFGQGGKPATFGFGQSTSTSLFGHSQQSSQSSTPFGQTSSANTGLFGNTGFGNTNPTNISGTMVKFSPVTGTDTMVKNGVTQTISTRHHCITCMKEYESKSLEELRLEDYSAGRKGIQGQSAPLFGAQNPPFAGMVSNSNTANPGFGGITSGFGTSSSAGLFSKPITGFGTPVTTSSTFAFNSTTSSNLFNSQTKPFGVTSSTPLFASGNIMSTPGSAFGNVNTQTAGFGNSFNSGQSNQNIGLFSQNKPTFNLPSSTNSFGFGQSSSVNSSNLFNSKPIGTGFSNAFSGVQTASFQPNSSGFGQTQSTGNTLFNNSFKPTMQPSGFSFGTCNAASSGLGASGTSIFNSPTKSNLFNNTTTPAFNGTGSFGSISSFGSTSNSLPLLGTNIFGSGTNTNNFQNNSSSIPVHQQILALVSAPFGDSPLLKNLLPASGKSEQFIKPSNSISTGLNNSQHKVIFNNKCTKLKPKIVPAVLLSKKSLFDGLEEEDPLIEAFQPRPNAKRLVLRPKSITLNEVNDEKAFNERCHFTPIDTDHQISDKENDAHNHKHQNDRQLSSSWLKSNFSQKKMFDEKYHIQENSFLKESSLPVSVANVENTITELRSRIEYKNRTFSTNEGTGDKLEVESSKEKYASDASECENVSTTIFSEISTEETIEQVNKAMIKLQRPGYYTIPTLSDLNKYVVNKTCIVPHFTVGRKNYGNVYFADSFDVYGLNLDEIVHFRHKEVIIYPDDTLKPPVGQGLNRKAQVTLDRVWPHDKTLHQPITDPKRLVEMDYEGKLRRVSAKHDTKFLEYRPETGSWVFKVEHFSKYGLSDSDDDEFSLKDKSRENVHERVNKEKIRIHTLEQLHEKLKSTCHSASDMKEGENLSVIIDSQKSQLENEISSETSIYSPTTIHAHLGGTKSHTLQLMKSSFFDVTGKIDQGSTVNHEHRGCLFDNAPSMLINTARKFEDDSIEYIYSKTYSPSPNKFIDMTLKNQSKDEYSTNTVDLKYLKPMTKEISFVPQIKPNVAVLNFGSLVSIPSFFDISYNRLKYVADIGIQLGKNFKPSWGPQMTLLSIKLNSHNRFSDNIVDETKLVFSRGCSRIDNTFVQLLQLSHGKSKKNENNQTFKSRIEGYLNTQLQYSKIEEDEGCLLASITQTSLTTNVIHALVTQYFENTNDTDLDEFQYVWKLTESLWGEITKSPLGYTDHKMMMTRKKAICEWFRYTTSTMVNYDTLSIEQNDQTILSFLAAYKLEEACNLALKTGDHCLALLLSQMNGTSIIRELMQQQIKLWQDTGVDIVFSVDRLKLFMVIAGISVILRDKETINVCENLDWKRAFAMHLWYLSLPTASIRDVIDLYDTSFSSTSTKSYSPIPKPDYLKTELKKEADNVKVVYDICYHLIKLYCIGNYPLEMILNPETHTKNVVDYGLSWMLLRTLKNLGYVHILDHVENVIHCNFAAQLEIYDLWHWAIFIFLHYQNINEKRRAVFDLLLHHVELDMTSDYIKKENFLKSNLKIPSKWIDQAKAIKAFVYKRYEESALYFISAGEWNRAHEIIVQYIVTDAIINGDYNYVKSLLDKLVSNGCNSTISGWTYQGQLIWDYITVTTELKLLLNEKNFLEITHKLQSLKPQLSSLCSKIGMFPCNTSKHRLCQAEMAKKALQLAKGLLMLLPHEQNHSNFLVQFISLLPLPEDCTQQELQPMVHIFV